MTILALIVLESVTPLEKIKFNAVYEQQSDFTCGVAAAASLSSIYWGLKVTEDMLMPLLPHCESTSTETVSEISLYDLQMLLEGLGFITGGFRLEYSRLVDAARKYGPLICHTEHNGGHFVLFIDEVKGFALLADPSRGGILVSSDEFLSTWTQAALAVSHSARGLSEENIGRAVSEAEERLHALVSWCLR